MYINIQKSSYLEICVDLNIKYGKLESFLPNFKYYFLHRISYTGKEIAASLFHRIKITVHTYLNYYTITYLKLMSINREYLYVLS